MLSQQLINGLTVGSIYALIAIGYGLAYSILEMINFAHGDTYMFGTYICLTFLMNKMNPFLSVFLAILIGGLLGVAIERLAYRPLRASSRIAPMISAVGVALVLRNGAQLIWGPAAYSFPPLLPRQMLEVFGLRLPVLQLYIFAIAAVLVLAISVLLKRLRLGWAVRAVSQDLEAARLMGIPVDRVITLIYALGAGLGVAGGILYSTYYSAVFIGMGFSGTMKAFTACILGGIGSLYGACLGGIVLGLVESLTAGYISSAYRDAITFGLLIIMLVFRPSGMLGRRISQKV
jgi:branched-chain amino acid transport system permease protein